MPSRARTICPRCSTKHTAGTRCPKCTARRGTRQQRGYDATHEQLRADLEPIVATGTVDCWRCKTVIAPDQPWQLGHDDLTHAYRGPEHRACNEGAPFKNRARQ